MILSLNPKSSLSHSYIKKNLARRHLTDSTLKKGQIFNQMKRFIDFDIGEQINFFQETQKVSIIKCILSTIEKQLKDKAKINWMKTFAIHALFRFFIMNYLEKKLLFQTLIQEINNVRIQITSSKCSLINSGLFSRSLSKIKRSLSTKSLKGMFGSSQPQNKTNKLNELQQEILLQYISYLQKLLHDWSEMQEFLAFQKSPMSSKSLSNKNQESKTNLVWKVFNIFKKLTKISKDFLRINQLLKDQMVYFFSMMNFISEDIETLYNPVVDEIRTRIKAINWQDTMKMLESKDRSVNLSKIPSQQIFEIHSMVEELGNVNEVVLYVFLGCFHCKYLYNKTKPSNFVSINDFEFDVVYMATKKIEQQRKKHRLLESELSLNSQRSSKDSLFVQNRFSIPNRTGQNRMNAVNYKSSKLRQMQKQVLRKV